MKLLKYLLAPLGLLFFGLLIAALVVHVRGIPTYDTKTVDFKVDSTAENIEKGERLASMLCVHCHLSPTTNKLTGMKLLDIPKDFGEVYSTNITQHKIKGIGNWTDGEIAYLLRTGVKKDGKYIPPYMPKFPLMTDEDMAAIILFLRSDKPMVQPALEVHSGTKPSFFTKLLSTFVFRPLPYPEKPIPPINTKDKVAYGKYLVDGQLGCYGCHSADFTKLNELKPSESLGYLGGGAILLNKDGQEVKSTNITMDKETGIGNWKEEEFVKAIKYGLAPNGKTLQYPMIPYTRMSDEEAKAIWAYLQTVEPISNK